MSKKSRFKTPFESKHDKGSQRLLKPPRQHFYQIFSSLLWKQLKNVSFTFILGQMFTYWLKMTSIIFLIGRIYCNQFKCHYLRNKNIFPNFFLLFWNLHQILNILKQKMTLIAYVFRKLRTPKNVVRYFIVLYWFAIYHKNVITYRQNC